MYGGCRMIRVGQHVVVRGEDEEAIVTAVHPDAQVEIEFLEASSGGRRRKRYAAEALEVVDR
jgi:cytidylate kinase